MHALAMNEMHPKPADTTDALAGCIEACLDCAQTCVSCADSCLAEEMVMHLRRCIRLNQDCADICTATAAILSRQTQSEARDYHVILEACCNVSARCGDECESHAEQHEHCRICAEVCRACEEACHTLLTRTLN